MKTVLLVEDNEDDIFFMQRACAASGVPHAIQIVKDGDAAIKYLSGADPYHDRILYPLPSLVFLDIRLRCRDGFEVLEWLRARPEFFTLPVVMLTLSDQERDIRRAYHLGATSYLVKHSEIKLLPGEIDTALEYWLKINIPPDA